MSTRPKQRTRVRGGEVSSPRAARLALTLLAIGILSACGGGSTTSTNTPSTASVSVSVSPAATSVDQGDTIQFSASVAGSSNHAVTWSVQEVAAGGSISQSGLYNAPAAAMNVHVVATSVADPNKSSSALVTVKAVSVSLPATSGVRPGRQQQFTAVVEGTVVKDVNWTVEEGSAGGIITADGVYTAPTSGGPFHVTARSVADPSKAATVAVVLTEHGFRMLNSSTLEPRVYHTATLLPSGKVLIAGGLSCDLDGCFGPRLSSAEIFNPATETFIATGSMSSARAGHTATLLNNGTVLVTGGVNPGDGTDATAEVYDPATGSFTQVGTMVERRDAHTASLLGDGRVLIAGGAQGGSNIFGTDPVATAEIFDPHTQSFSRVGDMPNAAASHTASVLLDGTVLVVGGYGNVCPGTQKGVAIFDPTSNSFTAGVSLPGARAEHTATTLNDGRVLITGGGFEDDCNLAGFIYDTAVVFNPATSSYSSEKTMREPRYGHSATLLLDGKVLVVGSLAELFDPATSNFVITGDPNAPRAYSRATRLADGRVLFTGSTAVAEIYE
jgi:Galactose oxidase, central domain